MKGRTMTSNPNTESTTNIAEGAAVVGFSGNVVHGEIRIVQRVRNTSGTVIGAQVAEANGAVEVVQDVEHGSGTVIGIVRH